jgi:hypothetical protein
MAKKGKLLVVDSSLGLYEVDTSNGKYFFEYKILTFGISQSIIACQVANRKKDLYFWLYFHLITTMT